MRYLDVFDAMLTDLQTEVLNFLRGNRAAYLYDEAADAGLNQQNRDRLCCALAAAKQPVPERESVVRALYAAECEARKQNPAENSIAAEILTKLLREYDASVPACDSDVCALLSEKEPEPDACIRLAGALGMTSYACTMVDCCRAEGGGTLPEKLAACAALTGRPADCALQSGK
ncbi:MAG: hypothetical protein K5705_04205 [Oscillospiraceae bacterium]|nr:hypothetical protein [Oscillospiraceae bacterium]